MQDTNLKPTDKDNRPYCSADGCYRREPCGPFCRDNGNFDKEVPLQDTNLKPTIKIEWLSDYSDCEQCGGNYADGAIVYLNGDKFIDMAPAASCYGGQSWDDRDVFVAILEELGYSVEARY